MKTISRGLGVLLGVVLLYLLLKPVPIDPAPWIPTPNAGFTGPFAPNSLLTVESKGGEGSGARGWR